MESHWKNFCVRIPQRWLFAVMGALALTNAYAMRSCLSLTITAMVAPRNSSSNGTMLDMTCPASESTSSSLSSNKAATFEWDEYTQGVILSSFFWGYITTQIPGGILATKFGGKHILSLGIFSTAIFTVITPTVLQTYGATGLIILRILMGFGEGTTFPALFSLIAQWAPPHERSKMTSVIYSGAQMGTILGTALSGVLIEYSSSGWPMVFHVFGAFGILWSFAWTILCYSYPDVHPFISEKEKKYLHDTMKEHTHRETQPTPWRHMLTSAPLWALIAGKFGREWGYHMMATDLPKYLSNVLKVSSQSNGFLTAIPNVVLSVFGIGSSWLADWLIKSEKLSRKNVRKISTLIASIGPAVFIVAASYAGCDQIVVVIFLTATMGMMGSSFSGVISNTLDLSPNYTGTLMAILTIVSSLCGMLAPYTIGLLTPNQALLEWRVAFWITFVIFCVTSVIFSIWADGEVQYWNDLGSWANKQKEIEPKEEVPSLETSTEINRT